MKDADSLLKLFGFSEDADQYFNSLDSNEEPRFDILMVWIQ